MTHQTIHHGQKRMKTFKSRVGFIKINSLCIVFLVTALNMAAECPFSKGVNLTSWFQAESAGRIDFGRFTRRDFEQIQLLGCDVIRLPINLHAMTDRSPNYTLEPLFFYFLDQAVDWAESLGLYLILDNHTYNPSVDTPEDIDVPLTAIWAQMAEHYASRSEYVLYEILNEPHGIADTTWNRIQQQVIDVIRTVDTRHTIVVGPAGWNSYHHLNLMPAYIDENLIYTFHFYDPFIFTHQGASWTTPSLVELSNVPFPFDPMLMPQLPGALRGSWVESNFRSYAQEGTVQHVQQLLETAVQFAQTRNVPLLCGEFGVLNRNCRAGQRVFWYGVLRRYLEEHGIAWTSWDYQGAFGLFKKDSNEQFDYDLNLDLLECLGLHLPEQRSDRPGPDTTGFLIYNDNAAQGMALQSATHAGTLNFYSSSDPAEGMFNISWAGASQYEGFRIDFHPDRDLSQLVNDGAVLQFKARRRGTGPDIDVRFLDSNNQDSADHPWRMKMTLSMNRLPNDGQWHFIQIPIHLMTEGGAWDDNTWFNPVGQFDWSAVDLLEFVAEHGPLGQSQYDFDLIEMVNSNVSPVRCTRDQAAIWGLSSNYPNPFNTETLLTFHLPVRASVTLRIINARGSEVKKWGSEVLHKGRHQYRWDGCDAHGRALPSGVYFQQLIYPGGLFARKMLLLR